LDPKFKILDMLWGTAPKRGEKLLGHICTIMQSFTAIGCTVAHTKTQLKLDIGQNTYHTSICQILTVVYLKVYFVNHDIQIPTNGYNIN